ncbi:hypothetical protein PR002_g16341 [Phytophthora rubi]|uniref:Secreted protein n=1 Tax=Phytophthora rubi TaxID=129364 RepID=A0A6A3KI18_9STRA|nr:hypothetical protein PR002_g16341 [Phytophthora rubi]
MGWSGVEILTQLAVVLPDQVVCTWIWRPGSGSGRGVAFTGSCPFAFLSLRCLPLPIAGSVVVECRRPDRPSCELRWI